MGAALHRTRRDDSWSPHSVVRRDHGLLEFWTIGDRRALFDEFNAMQKRNHGKSAELPHTEAGKGLPRTFADQFFKKGARKQVDEEQELPDQL